MAKSLEIPGRGITAVQRITLTSFDIALAGFISSDPRFDNEPEFCVHATRSFPHRHQWYQSRYRMQEHAEKISRTVRLSCQDHHVKHRWQMSCAVLFFFNFGSFRSSATLEPFFTNLGVKSHGSFRGTFLVRCVRGVVHTLPSRRRYQRTVLPSGFRYMR